MKLNSLDTLDLGNGNYIIPNLETATTTANLAAYGISTIPYTTIPNVYTLAAPITGVEKTILMTATTGTNATAVNTAIYTGSTAITISANSTTLVYPLFINLQPPYCSVQLIGLSTAKWGVLGTYGAVQFSTAGTYTT